MLGGKYSACTVHDVPPLDFISTVGASVVIASGCMMATCPISPMLAREAKPRFSAGFLLDLFCQPIYSVGTFSPGFFNGSCTAGVVGWSVVLAARSMVSTLGFVSAAALWASSIFTCSRSAVTRL